MSWHLAHLPVQLLALMPDSPTVIERDPSADAAIERRIAELLTAVDELRLRDSLKTRFLSNVSHDLRTPLSAMITHAEILRDGLLGELTDRQRASVEGIITGGRQLLTMVNEILVYVKGTANQLTLSITEFDVEPLVEQVRSVNASLLEKKALTFERRVAPELPRLRADRDRIAHVIGNLLGNAIAFTDEGGRVWISVRLERGFHGQELVFEVGDTGIGIARENHDLVFREFAQVDSSTSRGHHGTGLGLTIVRQLVGLHGGRVWLESELGRGSSFFFAIPESRLVFPTREPS
ncbi:MAG TPA: HAMP domain-containing sensor histidine kinase [Gemmatimonadaceae bacterium]|nr:HAMP domain-containing sensor histidine kinase [Gemmatimonadaceae bacterium]